MIRSGALVFAALLLPIATTHAQQNQPREAMPSKTDSHSQGTAPEGMGSTGWTGGASHIGTSNSQTTGSGSTSGASATADANSAAAADQPEMATGLDLKGPPTRFPANKTPE